MRAIFPHSKNNFQSGGQLKRYQARRQEKSQDYFILLQFRLQSSKFENLKELWVIFATVAMRVVYSRQTHGQERIQEIG